MRRAWVASAFWYGYAINIGVTEDELKEVVYVMTVHADGHVPSFVENGESGAAIGDVTRPLLFEQEGSCLMLFDSARRALPARPGVVYTPSACESPSSLRAWLQRSSAKPSRLTANASRFG